MGRVVAVDRAVAGLAVLVVAVPVVAGPVQAAAGVVPAAVAA